MNQLINYIHYAQLVAYILLGVKLIATGLAKKYRLFTLYVLLWSVLIIAAIPLYSHPYVYGWFYIVHEPIMWLCALLVLQELFGLVLEAYPGIRATGRKMMSITTVVAVAGSAIAIPFTL